MGSKARIVIFADSEPQAAAAARAAFDEIERLEQIMSDYRPASEIRRVVDAGRSGHWVPVSPSLFQALERSTELTRATAGRFSVTIGGLVEIWRSAMRTGQLPTQAAIDQEVRASAAENLEIDERRHAIRFRDAGMKIDFGGIGKGLAADSARRVIEDAGYPRCFVDLGGDIAVGKAPPGQEGWVIEVRTGLSGSTARLLSEVCIATSGDAEQFVEIEGDRYSHIIDPRSGWAVRTRRTATVIHPDGAAADALASAACVGGASSVDDLIARFPNAEIVVIESP